MDVISSAIFGGLLYDLLKSQASLNIDALRQRFKQWVIDDTTAASLLEQAKALPQSATTSTESLIQAIDNSPTWQALLQEIKPKIQQNHGVVADRITDGLVIGTVEGNFNYYGPGAIAEKKS